MDLYLDDRLLHGRIIHGWGRHCQVERYVLCSRRLADPLRCKIYEMGPERADCRVECHVPGAKGDLPLPRSGDFWLTDSCATATLLLEQGLRFQNLILIGLRDRGGEPLGEEQSADAESLGRIRQLISLGIKVIARRFPDDTGVELFTNDG